MFFIVLCSVWHLVVCGGVPSHGESSRKALFWVNVISNMRADELLCSNEAVVRHFDCKGFCQLLAGEDLLDQIVSPLFLIAT